MQKAPKDMTPAYAKWMTYLTWVLALALGSYFFQNWIDDKRNPNRHIRFTQGQSLVLKQNSHGHYLAPGEINNIPVNFLLDTGATDVVVPQALADKLALTRSSSMQVSTANGVISVHTTILDEVRVGGLIGTDIKAVINPYMDNNTVLLGMSFLKNLSLTQKSGYLTLSVLKEN